MLLLRGNHPLVGACSTRPRLEQFNVIQRPSITSYHLILILIETASFVHRVDGSVVSIPQVYRDDWESWIALPSQYYYFIGIKMTTLNR